jgi:hypothetical protein
MKIRGKIPFLARWVARALPGSRAWFDGTKWSKQLLLMEPLIDMFNHRFGLCLPLLARKPFRR